MGNGDLLTILQGDALEKLRDLSSESVQCCVTSPPFWGLRNYGCNGQLGLEKTPEEYVAKLVGVFREVRRVLKKEGTLWLNLGDSYASNWPCNRRNEIGNGSLPNGKREARPPRIGEGLKEKDLVGIPWMVAFALRADGWWLRSDIIWAKPNPMPESVTDRPTKSHEYLFLLTKSDRYFYDAAAIAEPVSQAMLDQIEQRRSDSDREEGLTRNKRSVWTIATQAYPEAHFATFPEEIPKLCILAGSRVGDVILDPFAGSGTTGMVAIELGRKALLIELNPDYVELIKQRCNVTPGLALA